MKKCGWIDLWRSSTKQSEIDLIYDPALYLCSRTIRYLWNNSIRICRSDNVKVSDFYYRIPSKQRTQSIKIVEICDVVICNLNSILPFWQVFRQKVALYMLLVDLTDIFRRNVEERVSGVSLPLRDQSLVAPA